MKNHTQRPFSWAVTAALWLIVSQCLFASPVTHPYFGIQVVDEQTGRGVPLVELETVNHLRYVTDSAGWIAFFEPGLMGQRIFFTVKSHGYDFPKDGFGYAGTRITPQAGKTQTIKIKRTNIAERLYRITGEGLYRDSVLLELPTPITAPLGTALVVGQDSTFGVPFEDQIYWFWGDTSRMAYPLGHFWMACATSKMPDQGGLAPQVGIDLDYLVDDNGFSRPVARMGVKNGPIWIDDVCVLPDEKGKEVLVCHYAHMESLYKMLDHGLALFDTHAQQFNRIKNLPMDQLTLYPGQAHPVKHNDHLYLGEVFPTSRFPATLSDFTDPNTAEVWTCLEPGSTVKNPKFKRTADNALAYAWQRNGQPVDMADEWRWLNEGKIKPEQASMLPRDVETGKPIRLHRGSVNWNPYRKQWIVIAVQQGGTSNLGEVWISEAPAITGPWRWAQKIVTHNKYTFYNPVHHPFFDQDKGRIIYFEGTYASTFSGNEFPTPRYDYNQIMYRLDLGSPQLMKALFNRNPK
jgi:hypothetical protein